MNVLLGQDLSIVNCVTSYFCVTEELLLSSIELFNLINKSYDVLRV